MKKKYCLLFVLVWMMLGCRSKAAADYSVKIVNCRILADHKTIQVDAGASGSMSGTDGKYYLFALDTFAEKLEQEKPAAEENGLTFHVPLQARKTGSLLYKKFAIAVKTGTKYRRVSDFCYLTNPGEIAGYHYAFPQAKSKKGLQIKGDMITDAEDLSVKHAAVNILLNDFLLPLGQRNRKKGYSMRYQGKNWWFSKKACEGLNTQLKKLKQSKVVVTGILLLQDSSAAQVLIPPAARESNKAYYGLNVMNRDGVEQLSALMVFLAKRYTASSGKNGRIANWVLGNEVEYYGTYNYMGRVSFQEYVMHYTRAFRLVSTALQSVYENARLYISLSHCWNVLQPDMASYGAFSVLKEFEKDIEEEGRIAWNLALHPYPADLTKPAFWLDKVSNSTDTRFVSMKNIGAVTGYLREKYGSRVRVILSEQGFTSKSAGKTTEFIQAAAFAYAYYISEFDDLIDAFIMHRHVDHQEEVRQGLNLGIWTTAKGKTEYASRQKTIWKVFKYIDTTESENVSAFALKQIGLKSWKNAIPGFSWAKFARMENYTGAKLSNVKRAKKVKKIGNSWKYAYDTSISVKGDGVIAKIHTDANPMMYRGVGRSFKTPLDFSSRKKLVVKIQVQGAASYKVKVMLRLFAGNRIYEASSKIKTGKVYQLSTNLSSWRGKEAVDKMQIWVRPENGKTWKKNSYIRIYSVKRAK